MLNYIIDNIKYYTHFFFVVVAYNAVYNAAQNVFSTALKKTSRHAYLASEVIIAKVFDNITNTFTNIANTIKFEKKRNFLIQEYEITPQDVMRISQSNDWVLVPRELKRIETIIPYETFKYIPKPINDIIVKIHGLDIETNLNLNIYDILRKDLKTFPQLLDFQSVHVTLVQSLDILPFDEFITLIPLFHSITFLYYIRRLVQFGVYGLDFVFKNKLTEEDILDIFSMQNVRRNYTLLYIKLSTLIIYLRGTNKQNKLIFILTQRQQDLILEILETYLTLYKLNEYNKRKGKNSQTNND